MANKFDIYQSSSTFFSNKKEAFDLASKSQMGEVKAGKVVYSVYEVLYLLENGKIRLLNKNKEIEFKELVKKADYENYLVFRDLRNKGRILKEGLKFGADFRVYEKNEKPGKNHAKYLVYALNGNKKIDLKTFSSKARIAHSTNKILLLAIVDSEEDVTYYETSWKNI